MHPILFTIHPFTMFGRSFGPFELYTYGLMLALAFAVGLPLLAKDTGRFLAPRVGLTPEQGFNLTFDLFTWVIPFSLVGGRLFFVVENHTEFTGSWLEWFYIWEGGLVYYGGLVGAVLAALVWLHKNKWPIPLFLDLAAPYILLGQAFGRVGCYSQGCCGGIVDPVHGVIFPGLGDNLPHLPTQLWELYGDLALFLALFLVRKKLMKHSGVMISLYAVTYGLLRYIIEFWRRDGSKHYLHWFLSPSQAMSFFLVLGGFAVLTWLHFREHRMKNESKTKSDSTTGGTSSASSELQ